MVKDFEIIGEITNAEIKSKVAGWHHLQSRSPLVRNE